MKRWDKLTAQDVIDAYERHPDVHARAGIFARIQSDDTGALHATEACAVSILAIDDGIDFEGFHDPGGQILDYLTHRLPRALRQGIQYGFDHDDAMDAPYSDLDKASRFYRGQNLGHAIREWAQAKYGQQFHG